MARTIAKDHDEKRQHILRVAAEVFAREGIARASMNDVARACGFSKANIYHYYSGKDALVFDILDSYLFTLRQRVMGLRLAHELPAAQLQLLTREFLLAYEGMDHEHKIQTEGLPLLPPMEQAQLKAYQRDMVDLMSKVLVGNAASLKDDPPLLRDITMSVFGMLNWFYMWKPGADRRDREHYANTVTTLTLNGLRGFTV